MFTERVLLAVRRAGDDVVVELRDATKLTVMSVFGLYGRVFRQIKVQPESASDQLGHVDEALPVLMQSVPPIDANVGLEPFWSLVGDETVNRLVLQTGGYRAGR